MFDYLRAAQETKEKFDFIILDPPSFSRSRKAVSDARRGYKEIHLRAFKILQPGGVLATFCCSHHVSAVMFLEFILDAAHDAHVLLRREAVLGAGPDHPVIPSIPETEYLKGFVFTVMPE
jgi:23S rRNA (cytosine1962-C5)-methyltransferase